MDHHRFDQIVRAVVSRRTGLGAGLATLLGISTLDAEARKHKKKPKKCKPACGACQECDKGKCKSVANGKACGGGTCQGGVCTPVAPAGCSQDNQVCTGDGRCLKGVCKPKPTCAPAGAQHVPDDTFQCCSQNQECVDVAPFGTVCTCAQHPYDATTGNACLSDQDCAGGECVGYTCRWCSGQDCPPVYEFSRTIGSQGTGSGQFKYPGSVAITPDGTLLVADEWGYRVLEFNLNGSLVRTIGTGVAGTGNNQFQFPSAIAVDQDGNIYVGDSYRVQKFSRTGVYLRTFGVAGVPGTDNQHLSAVRGLAIDSRNLLYVSDFGLDDSHGRIQVFKTDGTYVRTIVRSGLVYVGSVAVDANDHLYVQDLGAGRRLLEFDQNGTFVGSPLASGLLDYGSQFTFGPDGSFFMCEKASDDSVLGQVVQYSPTWERVRAFFTTTEPSPPANHQMYAAGVAVDSAGNLYIVDSPWIWPTESPPIRRILKYAHLTTGGHARDERSGKRPRHKKKRKGNGKG